MTIEIESSAPDFRSIFDDDTCDTFSLLMERRIAATDQIKALEEEKKKLDNSITTLLTDYDTVKVNYAGRPVSLVMGSRSSLSKEKLLKAGVTAATIIACTEQSSYSYLLVGKPNS